MTSYEQQWTKSLLILMFTYSMITVRISGLNKRGEGGWIAFTIFSQGLKVE